VTRDLVWLILFQPTSQETSTMTKSFLSAALILPASILAACSSGTAAKGPTPAEASVDAAAVADTGIPERDSATGDVAPAARPDAAVSAVCQHELDNPACWSTFDTNGLTSSSPNFFGALFDGRYVTFVNGASAPSLRYDTTGAFGESASWRGFSPISFGSAAWGFSGAASDGRYLYLVPTNAMYGHDAIVVRYDSQTLYSSGEAFNLTMASGTADPGVPGFIGAAFDGRYLYFAPAEERAGPSGRVLRFDTQATFAAAASWSSFDMTTVAVNAKGFKGAVFDGRYVYFVPWASAHDHVSGTTTPSGLVIRFDSTASFSDAGSWSSFDATTLSPPAAGFAGATFDGRYIYLPPNALNGIVAVCYDTQADFTSAASWASFDAKVLDTSGFSSDWRFSGASFDGRYVYFIPENDDVLVRYDVQASFTTAGAWSTFSMDSVGAYDDGFAGAAFDGRYLYIVSTGYGPMLRFDARTPPALPPGHDASFY
jgi:hypothetical protein